MAENNSCLRETYLQLLHDPSASPKAVAKQVGHPVADVLAATHRLQELGVLRPDGDPYAGTCPAAPPSSRAAVNRQLIEHASVIAEQTLRVHDLQVVHDALQGWEEQQLGRDALVVHADADQVRTRLEELSAAVQRECFSFNPGKARLPDAMEASRSLNQELLERGVVIRAIYQDIFVHDSDTLAYASWMNGLGAEIRVLPQIPCPLILIDAEVAFLPSGDANGGAYEVRNPTLVKLLHSYFLRSWSDARSFTEVARRRPKSNDDPMIRELLALLAEGETDASAARKLAVSERTVRRLVAQIMGEFNASSRLQLGVEALRRGWIA